MPAAARERLGVEKGFADYEQMLRETRPDLVAVCPRQPDQHHDMVLAAIDAGVRGLYVEKPFCRSPAEADRIRAACRERRVKLAVAHRNRYHPALPMLKRLVRQGAIGKVLEIRGRGKGDRRGGGEDLCVLGCHVMNLVHYFGGVPQSCSAILRQRGRPVTATDVQPGNEALGPLAGDEVHARYELDGGTIAYFDSIAEDGTRNAGFGLQLIGSDGIIDINCDREPLAYLVAGNPFLPTDRPRAWVPISSAGVGVEEPQSGIVQQLHRHVVPLRDLMDSIESDREPLCDVSEGAMTVEMICAVFASHVLDGASVKIPLSDRRHALARW